MEDSLYRNSIFLMANTASLAGFGFIFWALAAHYYTTSNVGITATLITVSTLVTTLSTFGFDNSFIRYLPNSKSPQDYIDSGFAISSTASLIVSVVYLLSIKLLVPKLDILDSSAIWIVSFILFMVLNMLNNLTNFVFIAFRKTHLVLTVNVGFGVLRLVTLVFLSRFGLIGLILSHVIATVIALLLTLIFMKRYINYKFKLRFVIQAIHRIKNYALSSYLTTVLLMLPTLLLPTIVIGSLGAKASAYYYVVSVIVTALNVIPLATSQSLFAESAWDESLLKEFTLKALKITFSLIVPSIIVLITLGKIILTVFGGQYASQGYITLVLLSVASLPKVLNYVFSTILRIRHRIGTIVKLNILYALIVLSGSITGLANGSGFVAIGISTLAAETMTAVCYAFIMRKPI